MQNVKLYLFRHGFTKGNIDKKYIGVTDEPLCEEGRAALCELYTKYKYPSLKTVFSSPLSRCVQSADILFPSAANKLIIDQLKECSFGEFENKGFEELKNKEEFIKWLNPQEKYTPKGGESTEAFNKRCAETLMKLLEYMFKSKTQEAAIVTHGGVIMSMLAQCALPKKAPENWMADAGCGYLVQCSAAMFMRDRAVEATAVLPFGYLDDDSDAKAEQEPDYFGSTGDELYSANALDKDWESEE